MICFWRGVEGIWTPDEDFADPCLTTWPRRHIIEWEILIECSNHHSLILSGRWDSNPRPSPWQGDVLPLYYARISWLNFSQSAETQDRTGDTTIFSRVLYQLSYLGKTIFCKAVVILHVLIEIVKKSMRIRLNDIQYQMLLDFLYPFRYNVRSLSKWDS